MIHTKGNLSADKVDYPDGINCCVFYPFEPGGDTGMCFDFSFSDIDDMIALLQELKDAPADPYVPTDDNDAPEPVVECPF